MPLVVRASAKPWRPSNEVMRFLLDHAFDVTPVNPGLQGQTIHNRKVVAELADATRLERVEVFRASQHVGQLVDRAIQLGAKIIWMQSAVIDHEPALRTQHAGVRVVMDRCPVIGDRRIGIFGSVHSH